MESTTITIDVADGTETLELPSDALEYFSGEEQSPESVVGDLLVIDMTHRLHGAVYHSEETPDDSVVAAESAMRELFEERFGGSFAELTGHSH